ncbi:MAG: hypothetical protein ACR2FX_09635 [Chthoniobacterales bacterium]
MNLGLRIFAGEFGQEPPIPFAHQQHALSSSCFVDKYKTSALQDMAKSKLLKCGVEGCDVIKVCAS